MIDKNKLMGKIYEAGYTQRSLAKALSVSKNTLNAKINGNGYFNTEEIQNICDILHIESGEEKAKIFLASTSHNRDEVTA